jgi:nucleoside-diphosphate-sugar epimerase
MRKVNIEGTANIVNFCIMNNVLKLCFVSSVAAVGKSLNNGTIDESCEWNVETSNYGYAITKHGAEMEVWRGTQEGLDVVIVNPGIILGGGFWDSGSGKIFDKVYNGLRFYTEGTTGYVGVEDVVKSMMKLMNSTIKNERFILVSENWSYKKVFEEIAEAFNKRKPSIKITILLSQIVWRVSSLISIITKKEPLLTKHSAESIHKTNIFSNAKTKEAIGIEFEPIKAVINQSCSNYLKEKLV